MRYVVVTVADDADCPLDDNLYCSVNAIDADTESEAHRIAVSYFDEDDILFLATLEDLEAVLERARTVEPLNKG